MRKNVLLVTVAATALIAGASVASAQGMNQQKSDAPKAQSAPQTTGQAPREGQGSGQMQRQEAPKASESAPKAKAEDGKAKAQDGQKQKSQTTGQAPREGQGGQMQQRQEGQSGQRQEGQRQEGQSDRMQRQDGQRQEGQRQDGQRQDGQRQEQRQQGQAERGGAGGSAQITSEQRTRISSVIKTRSSEARVSNVNFSVSVGTVVPRTVKLVALPDEVITIHPAWRGYRFFIVNDQIVVVEPDTLRIVAVLPA